MLLVVFLLVAVPVVELFVAVEVADSIGVGLTILALVALAVGGIWLVRAEGLGVLRRVQQQLERGELPTAEVVDGLLILTAGVLMLVPGFVTAAAGLLLLVPLTRRPVRSLVLRRLRGRLARGGTIEAVIVDESVVDGSYRVATVYPTTSQRRDVTDVSSRHRGPTPSPRRPPEVGPGAERRVG